MVTMYFDPVAERSRRLILTALSFLKRRSKLTITLFAVALVVFIGILDVKTGLEVYLHFFYAVPIALVSWFANRNIGIYVAVLGNIVHFFADGIAIGVIARRGFLMGISFCAAAYSLSLPWLSLDSGTNSTR